MTVTLFGGSYKDDVLALSPSTLLQYLQASETGGTGGGTANDASPNNRDGLYGSTVNRAGATGHHGLPVPVMTGTALTDYIDIRNTSNLSTFNGNLFTAHVWVRIPSAATWTSGTDYMRLVDVRVDANNYFVLAKFDSANPTRLFYELVCAGVFANGSIEAGGTTQAFSLSLSHNRAANRVRVLFNGAEVVNRASPGVWTGAPATGYLGCSFGGYSNLVGHIYDWALWNSELTAVP